MQLLCPVDMKSPVQELREAIRGQLDLVSIYVQTTASRQFDTSTPNALRDLTNRARNGDAKAQLELGIKYAKGDTTMNLSANAELARHWFQLVANREKASGMFNLANLLMDQARSRGSTERDQLERSAAVIFEQMVDKFPKNSGGYAGLARCYRKGIGGKRQDLQKARGLFETAAALGCKWSQTELNKLRT